MRTQAASDARGTPTVCSTRPVSACSRSATSAAANTLNQWKQLVHTTKGRRTLHLEGTKHGLLQRRDSVRRRTPCVGQVARPIKERLITCMVNHPADKDNVALAARWAVRPPDPRAATMMRAARGRSASAPRWQLANALISAERQQSGRAHAPTTAHYREGSPNGASRRRGSAASHGAPRGKVHAARRDRIRIRLAAFAGHRARAFAQHKPDMHARDRKSMRPAAFRSPRPSLATALALSGSCGCQRAVGAAANAQQQCARSRSC